MRVIDICEISTEETPIIVKGNNSLEELNYRVPARRDYIRENRGL